MDRRGGRRASAAENYVAACLDACLKGDAPAVRTTEPYGCDIKY